MTGQHKGRVLVVGMGVSGIATAARLHAAGWTPVLVERAPARRSGGYFVALFGAGKAAAARLGLDTYLHDRGASQPPLTIDRRGRRRAGAGIADLPGKPWLMLRGDVEQAAYEVLPKDVEIRYSTVPTAIAQDAGGVDVTLRNTGTGTEVTERYDLVVGADGLRSTVRSLVFGPHEDHLRRLGFMVVAFEYDGTPAGLPPGRGATLLEPGRSMWVFAFADHNPTVMLTYRTGDVDAEFTQPPAERVQAAFGPEPLGRTLGDVVGHLEKTGDALFDSVEQVRMPRWHRGRVVLVGDSAWCVTLYAGMGVSSGLTGADLLGAMLERHADVETALTEWERTLRPYIQHCQDGAFSDRKIFMADNRPEILFRRALPRLAKTRLGGRLVERVLRVDDIAKFKNADIVGEALRPPERTSVARPA
ncbi:FAD-dependent monooxygenase [Amycolatopsis sp. MtRt-6]|uniref:FAD-dependent monooxygenase n=1 Tax=Amycolatopsis sp. MtRt-6 TaxID=2792782 RepID=UPI001A8CCE25|nr:FAD-dependent monooxygenase [Amycolatopsis sp. MtRt-6]